MATVEEAERAVAEEADDGQDGCWLCSEFYFLIRSVTNNNYNDSPRATATLLSSPPMDKHQI
jgi:hypothetical protein